MGIDAIDNLGITYLSRTKCFKFQEELNPEGSKKADLRVIATLKIPAHAGNPVRLGTTTGARQNHMPSGVKAVSTFASLDFPYLFAQPGLVSPDHQGQIMILLQNCGDEDITIPRCSNIGYIENVKNPCFDEISEVKPNEWENKFSANAKLP